MRSTGIQRALEVQTGAPTTQLSCGATLLVPESIRLRGPPKRPKAADLQGLQGVARPGLEPGTPRFSAARPPRANVAALQRNPERVLSRRVHEDSRTFRTIAVLSGTRSRTCAEMRATRLRARGRPVIARSGRR